MYAAMSYDLVPQFVGVEYLFNRVFVHAVSRYTLSTQFAADGKRLQGRHTNFNSLGLHFFALQLIPRTQCRQ